MTSDPTDVCGYKDCYETRAAHRNGWSPMISHTFVFGRSQFECFEKYGERKHHWRWDRARCEVCTLEASDYVAGLEAKLATATAALAEMTRQRDSIQHQEINAARREFNGMRRRAEDAEVRADKAEAALAEAEKALEAFPFTVKAAYSGTNILNEVEYVSLCWKGDGDSVYDDVLRAEVLRWLTSFRKKETETPEGGE